MATRRDDSGRPLDDERASTISAKAAPGRLLDEFDDKRPPRVRGYSGYGNEGILVALETGSQLCLLHIRKSVDMQRLAARVITR
jgi:hypothetical protein